MQSQDEVIFGRKMDPCDYKATLATKDRENCVVITAYDGGKETNKENEKEM